MFSFLSHASQGRRGKCRNWRISERVPSISRTSSCDWHRPADPWSGRTWSGPSLGGGSCLMPWPCIWQRPVSNHSVNDDIMMTRYRKMSHHTSLAQWLLGCFDWWIRWFVSGVDDQKPGTLPNLHGSRVGEVEEVLDGDDSWRMNRLFKILRGSDWTMLNVSTYVPCASFHFHGYLEKWGPLCWLANRVKRFHPTMLLRLLMIVKMMAMGWVVHELPESLLPCFPVMMTPLAHHLRLESRIGLGLARRKRWISKLLDFGRHGLEWNATAVPMFFFWGGKRSN